MLSLPTAHVPKAGAREGASSLELCGHSRTNQLFLRTRRLASLAVTTLANALLASSLADEWLAFAMAVLHKIAADLRLEWPLVGCPDRGREGEEGVSEGVTGEGVGRREGFFLK